MRRRRTCCTFLKTCFLTSTLAIVLAICLFGGRDCRVATDNPAIVTTNIINVIVTETNQIDVVNDVFVTNYVNNVIDITNETFIVTTNFVTEVQTNFVTEVKTQFRLIGYYIDMTSDFAYSDKIHAVEEIVLLEYGIMTISGSNNIDLDGISHVSLPIVVKSQSKNPLYRNNGTIITNHKKYMYWMREKTHENKEIKNLVYLQKKN